MITRIAWAYYFENKTQQEIADSLHLNRMKVNRFLQKAKEMGIVQVSVSLEHGLFIELEETLKKLLNLTDVTVVPAVTNSGGLENGLARAGAFRINQILESDDILGVAWGNTLYAVAKQLKPVKGKAGKQLEVVQLTGGLANNSLVNPEQIVNEFAVRLDAHANWMNLPLIVGSREAKEILMNEPTVASTFRKARECTVCIVGLGDLSEESSLFIAGVHSRDDLANLRRAGAVGDIMSIPIDIDGNLIDSPLTDRTIAIPIGQVKKMGKRIAIALGEVKSRVIIGACRGGYINELITDEAAARGILRLLEPGY